MSIRKRTAKEKAITDKIRALLEDDEGEIEESSYYGDKESTQEMERILREGRIKRIMKNMGISRSEAMDIVSNEMGRISDNASQINKDNNAPTSTTQQIDESGQDDEMDGNT